jgi:multiple antibiotic resistance protein
LLRSIAAVAYAVLTGLTLYASGHVERRISAQVGLILDRIAGILLTSIAVILLANGFTDLVVAALNRG